ncbi:hypothetical protein [Treponema sp.]|uniref:hypothetical protein n=1 Tax=Treponema sp. TaxID=166 RepID=UPI003F0EE76F
MMKKQSVLLLFAISVFCVSCTERKKNPSGIKRSAGVSDVLEKRILQEKNPGIPQAEKEQSDSSPEISAEKIPVDFDLSKMNPDMAYAFLFQLMLDSESYSGKTIRMNGTYELLPGREKPNKYCIVTDMSACCVQGLEFEIAGQQEYSLEPGQKITISGVYTLYPSVSPDGMEYTAMKLSNAVLE